MQTVSVPNFKNTGNNEANRQSTNTVRFQKITSSMLTSAQQESVDARVRLGGNSSMASIKSKQTDGSDITARLSRLGQALKALLSPTSDHLLPGYSELIQLVKSTTVAAQEQRKEEEKQYYETQVARFSRDRRQAIKKDDTIRNFLLQKKMDIYSLIEHNMRKLRVFPENQSLISPLTAEEKVAKIKESLRNPQLQLLAQFAREKNKMTIEASEMSVSGRARLVRQRAVTLQPSNRSHTQALGSSSAHTQSMSSARSPQPRGSIQQLINVKSGLGTVVETQEVDSSVQQVESQERLFLETRDIELSDLGALLEDLEAIELEAVINQQEFHVPGQNRKNDEDITRNKNVLSQILQKPRLSELLQISVEKQDQMAALKAEQKFHMMLEQSKRNLAGRVHRMLGLQESDTDLDAHIQSSPAISQIAEMTNGDATRNESLYGDEYATPSQRALQEYGQMIKAQISDKTKYVPFLKQKTMGDKHSPRTSQAKDDDSYRYTGIEAIMAQAASSYHFDNDIDNSEEEELTDDELRDQIKSRKDRERSRRDDLTAVKIAALDAQKKVEGIRKQITVGSIVVNGINLDALKLRQAKLREKIDNIDPYENDRVHEKLKTDRNRLNQTSEGEFYLQRASQPHSVTQSPARLIQAGYEPCEEDEAEYSSSSSQRDDVGRKIFRQNRDPVAALEREMRRYVTSDVNREDTLDKLKASKYHFKASFISHLCAVKDRQLEYQARMKTFNRKKSTKGETVNEQFLENELKRRTHVKEHTISRSALAIYSKADQNGSKQNSTMQPSLKLNSSNLHKRSQSSIVTHSPRSLSLAKHSPKLLNQSTLQTFAQMTDSDHKQGEDQYPAHMVIQQNEQAEAADHHRLLARAHPSPTKISHSILQANGLVEGAQIGVMGRGQDLTCVHSSQLPTLNDPNQQLSGLRSDQLLLGNTNERFGRDIGSPPPPTMGQNVQGDRVAGWRPPAHVQNSMDSKLLSGNNSNSLEGPLHNHFSTMSLKIVLSPKGQSSGEERILAQSHSQQQYIQRRVGKQQESTVTVHDYAGNSAGRPNNGEVTQTSKKAIKNQSGVDLAKSDDLTTNQMGLSQWPRMQPQPHNVTSKLQQVMSSPRSLLNTQSSATITHEDQLNQKLLKSNDQLLSKQSLQENVSGKRAEFGGQTLFSNDQEKTPFKSQVDLQGGSNQNSKSRFSNQKGTEPASPNRQNKGSSSPLQKEEHSPKSSILKMIDLPQEPITRVSFEKSGQPFAVIQKEMSISGEAQLKIISKQTSKNVTASFNSPQFIISPRAEKTEQPHGAIFSSARDSRTVMDTQDNRTKAADEPRHQLQQTQFDFPIPSRSTPLDFNEVSNVTQNQITASFKAKMQKRFGVAPNSGIVPGMSTQADGFPNMSKNTTFYKYRAIKEIEMRRTQPTMATEAAKTRKQRQSSLHQPRKSGRNVAARQQNKSVIDKQSIVAREMSVGSKFTTSFNEKRVANQQSHTLGPTEYLSLSSQGSLNQRDDQVGMSPHNKNELKRKVVVHDQLYGNLDQCLDHKNIVKLALQERNNSKSNTSRPLKSGGEKKKAAAKTTMTQNSPVSNQGIDEKSENAISVDQQMRPKMVDDKSLESLEKEIMAQQAIEQIYQTTPCTGVDKKKTDEVKKKESEGPAMIRFGGKKQSMDSEQLVQTQGLASHLNLLNLADAATSPAFHHSKPTSPVPEDSSQLMIRGGKNVQKMSTNMGLPHVTERLEMTIGTKSGGDSTSRGQATAQARKEYRVANNMRKLSISILTSEKAAIEMNKQGNVTRLRISPDLRLANQTSQIQMSQMPVDINTTPLTRNMITPHLQSTNVKIALQKEKSKRMMQILTKKYSSKGALGSCGLSEFGAEGQLMIDKTGSTNAFLAPAQIDMSLILDKELGGEKGRVNQDLKLQYQSVTVESRRKRISDDEIRRKHATGVTSSGIIAMAETIDDTQDNNKKQLYRNESQPENPLLQCSEEDDMSAEPLSTAPQIEHNPHFNSSHPINLRSSYNKQQGSKPQSTRGKRKVQLGSQGSPQAEREEGLIAGASDAEMMYMSLQTDRRKGNLESVTKTPNQDSKQMAFGLGAEDIVTDGASQIRIEQDIKEMQCLLPPLLETASTKQFFKNDEIKLYDQNSQERLFKKQEAVPLQYIRNPSKLSEIEKPNERPRGGQFGQNPSRIRNKDTAGNQSPSLAQAKKMLTTGIQYSATPLSILQENPMVQSEIGVQSLLRTSERGSTVSISVKKAGRGGHRNSQQHGPYLKSFTQRIKLPNLNRSQYQSKQSSQIHSPVRAGAESPLGTHPRLVKPQSNTRASVILKQNNVTTTLDGETGGVLEKRMANNFQVKIKKQLAIDAISNAINMNTQQAISLDNNRKRFIDLHQSARNSQSYGMKVLSVAGRVNSSLSPLARDKQSSPQQHKLSNQILIYGGASNALKVKGRNTRQAAQTINMHETLTQVLMPPLDTKQLKKPLALPPKSLLYKGRPKENQGLATGTNSTRRSPLATSEVSQDANALSSLGVSGMRKSKRHGTMMHQTMTSADRSTQGASAEQQSRLLKNQGRGRQESQLSQVNQQHLIESGSMELSPAKKLRLAATIHADLIPHALNESFTADQSKVESSKAESRLAQKVDASTRVKMGSISPQMLVNLVTHDSHALQSQGSSTFEDELKPAVLTTPAGKAQEYAPPRMQPQAPGLQRSQVSLETLDMARQKSTTIHGATQTEQKQEFSTVTKNMEFHMFDEKNASPNKTDNGWSKQDSKEDMTLSTFERLNITGLGLDEHRRSQVVMTQSTSQEQQNQSSKKLALKQQARTATQHMPNQTYGVFAGAQKTSYAPKKHESVTQTAEEEINAALNEGEDADEVNSLGPQLIDLLTNEERLFLEHEALMLRHQAEEKEQAMVERFYTKQPISRTGQNDISNSVWFDKSDFSSKRRPGLVLKDLDERTRNGLREEGKSPFDKQEFIRADGQTVKLLHQTVSSKSSGVTFLAANKSNNNSKAPRRKN